MRRVDDYPSDPDAEAAVAVIDATLAGEPVDPEHAELAELALILAGQRPAASAVFAGALDERVADRFAGPARRAGARVRRRWLYAPGAMAGLAAAVAVVFVLSSGPGSRSGRADRLTPSPAIAAGSAGATSASSSASASGASSVSKAPSSGASGSSGPAAPSAPPGIALHGQVVPAPPTAGRQVVQSAQLSLSTRPGRVAGVAQQVYDVIGSQHGVVNSSTVTDTGSSSAYAQFQLSVPSVNLPQTLSALSDLRGAAVVSRSDSSQDITGEVGGAGQRLADARALRTSLLRQLAAATTTTAIDSLKAQIRDAEASISSDLSTLRGLHRQVDYTQISLTVNASMAPGHPVSSGASFTLGQAAHDAGRVLVIVAGVALIALAVLVPLALLGAIGLWLGFAMRRRRREQALDLI